GLQVGAARAAVPVVVDFARDFEGGMIPAHRLARGGDLVGPQGSAVDFLGAGLVGGAAADHGAAADQGRPPACGGMRARLDDGGIDGVHVVAVDAAQDVPAIGLEARRRVVGEPVLDFAVDGNAIVV